MDSSLVAGDRIQRKGLGRVFTVSNLIKQRNGPAFQGDTTSSATIDSAIEINR